MWPRRITLSFSRSYNVDRKCDSNGFVLFLNFCSAKSPNLPVIVEVGNRLTNSSAHPLQLLFSRESFVKTKAAKEYVFAGWEPKVNA